QARHAGSERAVERQREQGKLLARERLEKLLDPGSFFELDRYVRHREPSFGMLERRPYGDAVVTGYGTIFGRRVFVFSQDFTDFVLMVEGSSYMFITGPDVVKTVTGEEVTFEELGGAATHAAKSGVSHFIAPNEEACLEDARYLLSFLPQNNVDPPPYAEPTDPAGREDAELDSAIPDDPAKPYDMKSLISRVVDDGDFLEVHERWAENIVCCFARLNGYPVGVVGNQPRALAGVLDIDSSTKAARFVRTCDAFNIPLVTFVDVPGFLPGTAQEWGGIIGPGAN